MMTKEELIDMARKAGFVDYELDDGTTNAFDKRYEAFAKLVAEAEREALAQPENEPVAFASHGVINWIADKQFQHEADLYTTPPQRAWVGLTDEERDAIFELHHTRLGGLDYKGDEVMYDEHFKDATVTIYAKLKQKNGYTEEKNT